MRASILLGLTFLMLGGSAMAQEVQWLRDLRAREGQPTKEQPFSSKDAFITGRVLAKVLSTEIVRDGRSYALDLDIGSVTPASCEVIVGGFDLAAGLQEAADRTIREFSLLHGTLEKRAIDRIDAGAFGSSPYIAVDWLLVVNGTSRQVGFLKQLAVSTRGHALYCAHVEIGYSKSFQAAVGALARTVRFKDASAAPVFTEVGVARVNGGTVGVTSMTVHRTAAGVAHVETSMSLVLPQTADLLETLQTVDSNSAQEIDAKGSLVNAGHAVRANGAVQTNLLLTRGKGGAWLVSGQFAGATLEKIVDPLPAPSTVLQQARARRALFTRKSVVGATLTSAQWTVQDPTRVLETQTTVLSTAGAERLVARETVGDVSREIVLDKVTGLPSKATVAIGPLSIDVERVYVQGTF